MQSFPKQRGFKMASLNVVSLVKHYDEINLIMSDKVLDVLALNKTRLNSTVND